MMSSEQSSGYWERVPLLMPSGTSHLVQLPGGSDSGHQWHHPTEPSTFCVSALTSLHSIFLPACLLPAASSFREQQDRGDILDLPAGAAAGFAPHRRVAVYRVRAPSGARTRRGPARHRAGCQGRERKGQDGVGLHRFRGPSALSHARDRRAGAWASLPVAHRVQPLGVGRAHLRLGQRNCELAALGLNNFFIHVASTSISSVWSVRGCYACTAARCHLGPAQTPERTRRGCFKA